MSLPSIITWKPSFSVGIVDVDEDHKQLIKMINRLFGATLSSDPHQVLRSILHELVDYVVFHFEREENFMKRINYPAYAEHKQEHQVLLDSAHRFMRNLDSGLALNLKEDVEVTLRDWLVQHIQQHDKRLGTFFSTEAGINRP